MNTQLESNLDLILAEKTEKIIPENIKKGVTILGINGNLDLETLMEFDLLDVEYPLGSNVSYYFTNASGVKIEEIESNRYLISNSIVHCITNNDGLIRNDILNIESSSNLTIIVPKNNGVLSSHYDDNVAGLLGSVRTVQTTTFGSLTYSTIAGYKGIKTNGDGGTYVKYDLDSSISNYTVEFDFYKADTASYSRVCYLSGAGFEIEIKGASNNIHWSGTDYQAGWKQNAWNNLKLVKSGSNVSLYMNGKLIVTRSFSGALTGMMIGRGSGTGDAMNAYYKNLIIKDNSVVIPNNEYIITSKQEDLQEQLDNQDRIIVELQNALENKSGGCIILDVTENDNVKVEDKILVISKGSRLPNEYQQVAYIKSTGTQYIDTKYKPNNNTEIRMGMETDVDIVYDGAWVFGSRTDGTSIDQFVLWAGSDVNRFSYRVGDMANAVRLECDILNTNITATLNSQHYIIKNNDITVQGDINTNTFVGQYNLFIFACNIGGNVATQNSFKLYSFKILENNLLIRDFVPCYRKSDNVIGLYDLIHDVFYTNQGTGTFLKGADV